MRLTTKGRFAVTAMIDLALRQDNGPVTLAGISQRQEISLSYLEQLFGKLRRHEIVESVRGPGGGYNLARKAEDVTGAIYLTLTIDEDASRAGQRIDGFFEHYYGQPAAVMRGRQANYAGPAAGGPAAAGAL